MSDDRIFDVLPLEVAQVLHDVVTWSWHMEGGRTECAASHLAQLRESAVRMMEWVDNQPKGARLGLPEAEPSKLATVLYLVPGGKEDT